MSDRRYDYLLSLGSNIDPARRVAQGLRLLRARFDVLRVSPCYDVAAVGVVGQPPFVNLAARVRTDLPPRGLREACRRIEEVCGRKRGSRERQRAAPAPRTLDVDVVFAAPDVPDGGLLPHADLLARGYVLCPCAIAWPEAVHPREGRTLADLARLRFPGWEKTHRRRDPGAQCDGRQEDP